MRAITELGYETPSPIQLQALPILLGEPTDFLGLAATGTGKTAAFAIPLLEKIDPSKKTVQALVLCPTRELAVQVAGQINILGKYKGIRALPIYGGAGYNDQISGLRRGVNVVVGTPGRLCDHLDKGTLKLADLQVMILDEADEMISMGFKDDLERILQAGPGNNNVWLFSATMSSEVRKVADEYLTQPEMVQINRTEMLSGTVEQFYYATQESNKPEVLCKLVEAADDFYGLVFCQTKSLVTDLVRYMQERGYKADCLHGDMDQKARERTMQAFRDRKVTLLVCTDVASRGLDVKDITHVINYSLPRELDNYVHRIGRTGRSGKTGIAMSLVTASHRVLVTRIERMTKSKMKEGKIPTRREIASKKVFNCLETFKSQSGFAKAAELLSASWKESLSTMSGEEIAARFLMISFPEFFVETKEPAMQSEYRDRDSGSSRGGYRDGGSRDGGSRGGGYRDGGRRDSGYSDARSSGPKFGPKKYGSDRPQSFAPNPNGPKISIRGSDSSPLVVGVVGTGVVSSAPVSVAQASVAPTPRMQASSAILKVGTANVKAAQNDAPAPVKAPFAPKAKTHSPATATGGASAHGPSGAKATAPGGAGGTGSSPWEKYRKTDEKSGASKKNKKDKGKKRAWDKPLSR